MEGSVLEEVMMTAKTNAQMTVSALNAIVIVQLMSALWTQRLHLKNVAPDTRDYKTIVKFRRKPPELYLFKGKAFNPVHFCDLALPLLLICISSEDQPSEA